MKSQSQLDGRRIRVVLVEDDEFFRADMERWLRQAYDLECVGSYRDGETALPNILKDKPDVAVLDFGLPGVKGDHCILWIKEKVPQVRILVVTGILDDKVMFDSLSAGADGFLEKSDRPPFLNKAEFHISIREIFGGGAPLSHKAARFLLEQFNKINSDRFIVNQLTEKEREVLLLLRQGLCDKEIASKLSVSLHTVHDHEKHMYAKLGVHSRTEAVWTLWCVR